MCQVEEKIVSGVDGTYTTSERSFLCPKSRHGRLCSNTKKSVIRYQESPPRDDNSSPASYNPPTPSNGTYLVQPRRPSDSGGKRPSTRDGARVIKPEIIIEFGRKNSSKKYPAPSTRSYKRSSLGTASIASNDVAIESPSSDASFTVHTGFPEDIVPTADPGFTTRHAAPQSHHRHNLSSASSITTSSQPPSLYATSEPDSPSTRRPARYPPTIVHNPPAGATSSTSPVTIRHHTGQSGTYRTTVHVPRASDESVGVDGIFPVGYSNLQDQSNTPHASIAPEITGRDEERARQRQLRTEAERKRQDEAARQEKAEEEVRQVRFDLGHQDSRAKARAKSTYAEHERRQEEARHEVRRRRQREEEERLAQEQAQEKAQRLQDEIARKEKEVRHAEAAQRRDKRPPVRDPTRRHSRRTSMSQQDIIEQRRLLAETEAQMAREREAADQRDRDERATLLRQQQQTTQYWDPRGGDRQILTNENPGINRRGSVRRGSVSSTAPPVGLGRTNSQRRVSIIQNAPPTSMPPVVVQQPYGTRPASGSFGNMAPPPVFSPGSSNVTYTRPPSARNSTYLMENPFAQPPTRISNTSQDNPFLPNTSHPSPPTIPRDPWAADLRDALPPVIASHQRTPSDDRQRTLRTRGEEVIKQSGGPRKHDRARQATRTMGKVVGYEDDYAEYSEEERSSPRKHHSKSGKRRGI